MPKKIFMGPVRVYWFNELDSALRGYLDLYENAERSGTATTRGTKNVSMPPEPTRASHL